MSCKNLAIPVLACITTTFVLSSAVIADIMTFQQGPNGYARAQDSAIRWAYSSEIGFITSVTESFCGDCSRVRLSAVGQIYTCLFATEGYDIRDPLRAGASDQELLEIIHALWCKREDRYSELRGKIPVVACSGSKVEMSHIGG